MLIAVPVGIGAGIYLSEYGNNRLGAVIRFLSDVLTGTPSIVLGYFSYIVFVTSLGWGFSLLAAAITLAILIVPYLARITEMALRQVPVSMREAAFALGATEPTVVFKVVLPGAASGVVTGALLALAISVGETAPLIYTAGWSNFLWNGHFMNEPVGYLTYVIWTFIDQPNAQSHALAFAAAFLVMLVVLAINIGVRLVVPAHEVRLSKKVRPGGFAQRRAAYIMWRPSGPTPPGPPAKARLCNPLIRFWVGGGTRRPSPGKFHRPVSAVPLPTSSQNS